VGSSRTMDAHRLADRLGHPPWQTIPRPSSRITTRRRACDDGA
jgi:hypothetical protein